MPLIPQSIEGWYKEFSKEEKIWIAIACLIAVVLATTTISWPFIDPKHEVPSSAKEFTPAVYKELANNFSKMYDGKLVQPNVDIYIAAQQYYWSVSKLILKKGVDYRFHIGSLDVIHGFTIVGNGTVYSIMVMPGMEYDFTMNFKNAGTYYVVCSEYCGYGHGGMRMMIEVVA